MPDAGQGQGAQDRADQAGAASALAYNASLNTLKSRTLTSQPCRPVPLQSFRPVRTQSPPQNPQLSDAAPLQAMDRAHRIGQTKPVLVLRLATQFSVEGRLLARANSKLALERLVIKRGTLLLLLQCMGQA